MIIELEFLLMTKVQSAKVWEFLKYFQEKRMRIKEIFVIFFLSWVLNVVHSTFIVRNKSQLNAFENIILEKLMHAYHYFYVLRKIYFINKKKSGMWIAKLYAKCVEIKIFKLRFFFFSTSFLDSWYNNLLLWASFLFRVFFFFNMYSDFEIEFNGRCIYSAASSSFFFLQHFIQTFRV